MNVTHSTYQVDVIACFSGVMFSASPVKLMAIKSDGVAGGAANKEGGGAVPEA